MPLWNTHTQSLKICAFALSMCLFVHSYLFELFCIVLWICVCLYLTVLASKQRLSYNKGLFVHSLSFYPIYQTWVELSGGCATPNSPGSKWRTPTPPSPPAPPPLPEISCWEP